MIVAKIADKVVIQDWRPPYGGIFFRAECRLCPWHSAYYSRPDKAMKVAQRHEFGCPPK